MAVETLERTNIWLKAFGSFEDGNDKHRERFKVGLIRFRERVGDLLTFIPGDMKNYTVHDLSHLDALWEMAQLIAGEDFTLNPAEAFVFGGAVLLHDAGMSIAAYPEGLDSLKNTPEWKDSHIWACSVLNIDPESSSSNNEAISLAITDVLRKKHAEKADELATQAWINPIEKNQDYLLEDSDLRSHFGAVIGAIANSHHWSIRRIIAELQPTLGAFGETPSEWTVDNIKLALLLRCADASHLDHRRAPRLLFALTNPTGISRTHWTFQAKLTKPQAKDGKLLYSSRSAFKLSEVDAWHLCWDTIKMVDRELSDSCDVLRDRGIPSFFISGVVGAKSADALAKHVLVDGWRPIPAELQVSDVPHLARTLGGRDLYSSPFAPLREILQNAADAIDARNALDVDFSIPESQITVKITKEDNFHILSVEDNGLGMSEKTMTGSLLDFGTSFWKTDAARTEFPGLQAHFQPRGRYGIGFFSVFMWADSVKVSSRKFNEGINDARILEFISGLGSRPILRPATTGESSSKFSTKISLKISNERWQELFKKIDPKFIESHYYRSSRNYYPETEIKESTIASLTAMLRIPVFYGDSMSTKLVNLPDWETTSSENFISFLEKINNRTFSEKVRRFAKSETLIKNNEKSIGRAFLCPNFSNNHYGFLSFYELGILIEKSNIGLSIIGIAEGRAKNAARDKVVDFDIFGDNNWIEKQKDYMARLSENVGESIACQESLVKINTISRNLPIALLNRKESSLEELIISISKKNIFKLALISENGINFRAKAVSDTGPFIGKEVDEDKIYFLIDLPDTVEQEKLLEFIKNDNTPLFSILRELTKQFGENFSINSTISESDSYSRRKILNIEIRRTPDTTN